MTLAGNLAAARVADPINHIPSLRTFPLTFKDLTPRPHGDTRPETRNVLG
jgi:hypothetical protein